MRISEEQAPLMLLEAIRLSAVKPVAADCAIFLCIVYEVCPSGRVVFLVTDAERAAREDLDRPDHQDLNSFVESLPRADEIKENIHRLFVYVQPQSWCSFFVITLLSCSSIMNIRIAKNIKYNGYIPMLI